MACAVAVSSLALSATGASAFFHPSPGGHCRVTIHAPVRITAGESATVFGQLVCRRNVSTEGKIVRLFRHVPGAPGSPSRRAPPPAPAAPTSSSSPAHGRKQRRVARALARRGEHNRSIRVAAQVTLTGPPEGTQLLTGLANKVTFTGTVTPADVGARVILQRQNAITGNEWHRIDVGPVAAAAATRSPTPSSSPATPTCACSCAAGDATSRALERAHLRDLAGTEPG